MKAEETESSNVSGMVLGLLAIIWFIGVPLCLFQAIVSALTRDAELGRGVFNAWLAAAAVIFTVAPVLATGICVFTGRVVRAWIFGVVATACVLFVLAGLYKEARQAELRRPPPPLPSGYCAEYSGGDSDCPGG
ncbi:hypothetical protein ACGFI3_23000 [Nonomuraea wenchangensis]|uniref:hypothetical protein n=1 Tax=Nonomuraea wenchangensis TaxID=568860 RepID=UPI00371ED25F